MPAIIGTTGDPTSVLLDPERALVFNNRYGRLAVGPARNYSPVKIIQDASTSRTVIVLEAHGVSIVVATHAWISLAFER